MTATTDLLTTAEVSGIIRKPAGTLRYWRSIGQGPTSFRVGSTVVYDRAEVEAWLAAQREATARGEAVAS